MTLIKLFYCKHCSRIFLPSRLHYIMITFIIQFCSALSLTKLSEIIVLGRLRLPKTIISEYHNTKNFYYKFLIVVYLITTTKSLLRILYLQFHFRANAPSRVHGRAFHLIPLQRVV